VIDAADKLGVYDENVSPWQLVHLVRSHCEQLKTERDNAIVKIGVTETSDPRGFVDACSWEKVKAERDAAIAELNAVKSTITPTPNALTDLQVQQVQSLIQDAINSYACQENIDLGLVNQEVLGSLGRKQELTGGLLNL